MSAIAVDLVLADSSISAGAVIAVVIILALIVLSVSLWLFRLQLKARRAAILASRQHVVKRCPNCKAIMEPGASFCPSCGRPVPQVTTVAQ